MTFPAFSRSPRIFLSLLAFGCVLVSCATTDDTETKHHRPDRNSNRFEWAVQHYEAGDYSDAIHSFESLTQEGSSLPEYDLLSFYIGMSQFKLAHYPEASKELEAFLRSNAERQEIQQARIALLLSYEKLERWEAAASLAAETDKLTLFQDNRAILKLVWARALREQGELLGAKAELEEAQPFLDKVEGENGSQPFYADPDQDLWGRYHFTALLLQVSDCSRLTPKEIAKPAPASKKKSKKKIKPASPKRIYQPWLEGVTDCYRKAVTQASDEIFNIDTPWSTQARSVLASALSDLGSKIEMYLKDEAKALDRHRALEIAARENLYRLLNVIESKMKDFKNQNLSTESLETLRKIVDPLLAKISSP
jgi:tetratricopeptide (TPR) repeat protein